MKRLVCLATAAPLLGACLVSMPIARSAAAQDVAVARPVVQTVAYRPWYRPYGYYGGYRGYYGPSYYNRPGYYGYRAYRPYYYGRSWGYSPYSRPYMRYGYYGGPGYWR